MLGPWDRLSGCTLEPPGESCRNPTPVHIDGHLKLEAELRPGHELVLAKAPSTRKLESPSFELGSNSEPSSLDFNISGALDSGCAFWGDLKMSSCALYRSNQRAGGGVGRGKEPGVNTFSRFRGCFLSAAPSESR